MTRRDLQNAAKKEGKPWDMGKGFDQSAPIGLMVPASKIGHPATGLIELKVNGTVRQTSDLSKMIWSVPEMIAYLSGLVKLAPGDLIYQRHAGERRGGATRRPAGGRCRGRRFGEDPHRLMASLRVATWNINSLRLRVGLLDKLVEALRPDVICLQETKVPDALFPGEALEPLGYPHTVFRGMKGYNGVAILSRVPLDVHDLAPDWCGKGDCRHVAAALQMPGRAGRTA